jgi:hypothetical protein
MKKIRLFAAAMLASVSLPASADNYNFYLHNRSDGWVINGFYTNDGGGWSSNWLSSRVGSGRSTPMRWNSQSGSCRVQFRVSWVDWGSQTFNMDWCRNRPSNVYMQNEGFTWD